MSDMQSKLGEIILASLALVSVTKLFQLFLQLSCTRNIWSSRTHRDKKINSHCLQEKYIPGVVDGMLSNCVEMIITKVLLPCCIFQGQIVNNAVLKAL